MTARTTAKETVLVLDEELQRRIVAAARLVDLDPTEFLVRAVQHGVADVLGEAEVSFGDRRQWAIRPSQGRVLRTVADAVGVTTETLVGLQQSPQAGRARAVAAYLLLHDAGLSPPDIGRILHRKTARVKRLITSVERVLGSTHVRAQLVERARRAFKNGLSSGLQYPPLPSGTGASRFLPGLLAAHQAAGLSRNELAERAGLAPETLSRLERLHRAGKPETVEALAQALGVPASQLTAATQQLPGLLRPTHEAEH